MSSVDASRYLPVRLVLIAGAVVAFVLAVTAGTNLGPIQTVVDALVDLAGYDYVIAAALGVLAILAGLVVFVSGRGTTMHQTEMPAVERPVPVPAAGEPFDEQIGGWRFATRLLGGGTADSVRDRLRSAAVAALAAEEGCSRATAHQRIDEGTWTDDDAAAAFLSGEYTPLGTWLVALTKGQTGPEYRARRTVAAIVAIRGDERGRETRGQGREESRTQTRSRPAEANDE